MSGFSGRMPVSIGLVQLQLVSATQIKLVPLGDAWVRIAGLLVQIPSAGITIANTGTYIDGTAGQNLAASTVYYVYLFLVSGALTGGFSTTGHATDTTAGNVGTEIKTGDNSRSLIGIIRTNSSSQFVDNNVQRFVRSWFSKKRAGCANAFTASRALTSVNPTFAEINSEIRCEFLLWAGEVVEVAFSGSAFPPAQTNGWAEFAIAFDSATVPESAPAYIKSFVQTPVSTQQPVVSCPAVGAKSGLSEGYHYATVLAMVSSTTGAPATDGLGAGFSSLALTIG